MQIVPYNTKIDFMGKRWIGFSLSLLLTLLSLGVMASKGLNLGIDFTGGILMEVHTEQPLDLAPLRESLSGGEFGEVSLQNSGSAQDVLIRVQVGQDDDQAAMTARIKEIVNVQAGEAVDYRKIDFVGPTVGRELVHGGVMAVLLSFAAIMLYIWFRFEWQYGVGAIIALAHDSVMMLGFFAVTRFEFGLTAIAAILTIVGYSINDSVVIYDRIRENMRRFRKKEVFELINLSINDTLSRTILTATTTLLASCALGIFGGEVIKGFAWAMVFGVLVGTYSSIYLSAPTLYYLRLRPEDAAVPAQS